MINIVKDLSLEDVRKKLCYNIFIMSFSKTLFLNKLTFFYQKNYQTIHQISNEAKKRSIETITGYIPCTRKQMEFMDYYLYSYNVV